MLSFTDTAAISKRLAAYDGKKSARFSYSTVYGALFPTGADANTVALHMVGQAYTFVTDGDSDVAVRDELTIGNDVYVVRGIQPYANVSTNAKVCYLEKTADTPSTPAAAIAHLLLETGGRFLIE